MDYRIDKNSDVPVYRQIAGEITDRIRRGDLKAGDRLLPERELAERLGTARGTIKKAYEELAKEGIIDVLRGSGSFVALDEDPKSTGRKEIASFVINKALDDLGELNMSFDEIRTLIEVMIMERANSLNDFHIAAIDCNPEALSIYEKQLLYLSHMKLHKFLLEEALTEREPEKRFGEFDLILTTSTHYEELCGRMPGLKERFIRAAVSPSQQTIIDIAAIAPGEKIGVISRSRRFYEIIRNRLKTFQIDEKRIAHLPEDREAELAGFLENCRNLIVPPDCRFEYASAPRADLQKFREQGGRVIPFEYRIQRGSMIHIEERIAELLKV